jgi:hypothetical protein
VSEGRLLSAFEDGERNKQRVIIFAINIGTTYVDSSNFKLAENCYLFVRACDALLALEEVIQRATAKGRQLSRPRLLATITAPKLKTTNSAYRRN